MELMSAKKYFYYTIRIRFILFYLISVTIQWTKLTCGTCKNYNTDNCSIVCDRCSSSFGIFEKGNLKTFSCMNYKPNCS